ncbi:MAG: TlpA family protein disulfide reductase, partial [Chitinophagaceae bacterium]
TIIVKGSVEFVDPKGSNKIWLYKDEVSGKDKAIDSVTVNEDHKSFRLMLHQNHPGIYHIDAMHWDEADFWSDANVSVQMRGYDTARYKMKIPHYNFVEGSMDNNFINLYNQIGDLSYLRMIDEYNEQYYAKKHKDIDSAWITYLTTTPRYDSLSKDYQERYDVLMRVYKDRPVLLYALRGGIGPESSKEYNHTLSLLDGLIKRYPWLTEAKQAKKAIITNREMASKVKPGMPLPAISYPDVHGTVQGLEKYKGKYLLIDFWASWCGPCRQAIPKVKELYEKYHPSELNVVSISIDASKKAWEKAMEEEKMPWEQLLSPNETATMKQFQFSGIPTMYLVDPEGKIVKTFAGYGPDTEATIKSVLKNKIMAPSEGRAIPAASF